MDLKAFERALENASEDTILVALGLISVELIKRSTDKKILKVNQEVNGQKDIKSE
jgi:hypothetical protein